MEKEASSLNLTVPEFLYLLVAATVNTPMDRLPLVNPPRDSYTALGWEILKKKTKNPTYAMGLLEVSLAWGIAHKSVKQPIS